MSTTELNERKLTVFSFPPVPCVWAMGLHEVHGLRERRFGAR